MLETIDVANLMRVCGQLFILQITTLPMSIITMGTLLKRKRSYWILVAYILANFFFKNVFVNEILGAAHREDTWWQILWYSLIIALWFVAFAVFLYVYEGSFVKVALASMLIEIIDMGCVVLSLLIVHTLAGTLDNMSLTGEWSAWSLLIPPIGYILYAAVWFLLRPITLHFRNNEPKHMGVWWLLYCGYMVFGFYSNIPDQSAGGDVIVMTLIFPGIMLFLTLLISCIVVIQIHVHRAEMEYQYLEQTKRITESQYRFLNLQIKQMESKRLKMDQGMEKVLSMKTEGLDNRQISDYIDSLHKEYTAINNGIYSNNWALDALLCHEAAICKQYGIRVDFLAQEFQPTREQEEQVFPVILQGLELGIRQNQNIEDSRRMLKLHIATVKNCIVFDAESGCTEMKSREERRYFRTLRKNGYSITQERMGNRTHVIIMHRF